MTQTPCFDITVELKKIKYSFKYERLYYGFESNWQMPINIPRLITGTFYENRS